MVSLYRSVSRKEMTPSGKGEELLKSMVGVKVERGRKMLKSKVSRVR